MSNNKSGRGMGVGYVSLAMLFAVICLTVLAALSYQAARANDMLNEKSVAFTDGYYSADTAAKELLAQLDEAALLSYESGFFDDSFPLLCEEYDGIELRRLPEGYETAFVRPVSDNLSLSVRVVFFSKPDDGRRFYISEWKTVSGNTADDAPLGVWDGGAIS